MYWYHEQQNSKGLLLRKRLSTIDKTALGILTTVDEVRVIESEFDGAVDDVIDGLDTQHKRMVLVTDLVTPRAEAAARPDIAVLQLGQELGEGALALERWRRVAVVEAAVVGGDDLVGGTQHLRVHESLDALLKQGVVVDRLHGGLGDFQHDGPVRAFAGVGRLGLGAVGDLDSREFLGGLRLVVGGVVGEDGRAVEGAVVFGEVEPALVADAFRASAADADTDDVGGGVEELLAEADQLLVAHLLGEVVDRHGRDQPLIADGGAVLELDSAVVGVNLGHLALLAEAGLLLGDGIGHGDPDTTGTAVGGETERSVGTPATSGLLEDDIGGDGLDVGSGDTLTEPGTLHLRGLAIAVAPECEIRTLVVGTAQTL